MLYFFLGTSSIWRWNYSLILLRCLNWVSEKVNFEKCIFLSYPLSWVLFTDLYDEYFLWCSHWHGGQSACILAHSFYSLWWGYQVITHPVYFLHSVICRCIAETVNICFMLAFFYFLFRRLCILYLIPADCFCHDRLSIFYLL